jgi:hypothetical protein
LLAFLLALALPFALVACGDDEGGNETESSAQESEEPTESAEEPPEGTEAQTIRVVATEYAFEGLPTTTAPGSYTFEFQNDGKEPHELVLFQVLTDTPIDELLKMPEKEAQKQVKVLGGTGAKPGGSAKKPVEAELEAGTYAAVCFVPVKGNGPPHFTKGMVHEMVVE